MKKIYFNIRMALITVMLIFGSLSAQVIITLGSGTVVTSNTTASPINQFYRSLHCQMVYTAAELNAACISSGTITKLGFFINTGVTNVIPNYTIKLKHTTALNAATYDGTGLTTVYNNASYTPVAGGFDMLTLNTPFVWDGTSNILVDVCFDQVSAFTSTGTIRTYSAAVTNGFIFVRSDSSPQCGVSCSTTSTNKPQIQFELTNVPAIDFTLTSLLKPLTSKGCFGTDTIIASVKNYGTAITDFSVTPAVININVSGASVNTLSLALISGTLGACATKDYTITTNYAMYTAGIYNFKGYITIAGDGFATNDTTTSVITKSITPIPNLGNDSLYCSLPVILNANTSANSYLWNNGSISSSLNVTSSGKYWIRTTNSNGCTNSDTILVSLGSFPIVTLGSDTAFCQGSTINLYAGSGAGNNYMWSNGATTSSIAVGTTGSYSVVVTSSVGCQSSDIINVSSKPKPSVSLVFGGIKSFCENDNVNRLLTEGSPANGTYIGAGVTATTTGSYFNPTTATQGSHIILYNYTGANGCSNTAKDTLVVNACVGVEELSSNFGLNIFPNPTTGVFTIELDATEEINAHISIMTIDSKLVYDVNITGNGMITKNVNLDNLADGIYYLKLDTKDSSKTYKILKQ
ncbi:MAG: putative Gingipain [Bacteroidetes bacterium]|nr:putative Gingipain [Bacteroidota bacterium]